MNPRHLPAGILGAALALAPALLPAQETDASRVIERAARAYQALPSFSARFRQEIADTMIGTFESSGTLVQAGESRLVMRFQDPEGDAIVMDGEFLWVYTPSTTPGQVIRLKVPSDPTYGPNLLAWFLTDPARRYQSRYLRSEPVAGRSADVVSLIPIDPSLPFTEAILWLDRYDHLPRRIDVAERSGQRRTLDLRDVQTGLRPGPTTFRFTVPRGVRIVDQ